MKVWLALTLDKYSLPVAIADSREELARKMGVKPSTITSTMYHYRNGLFKHEKYICVEVEED